MPDAGYWILDTGYGIPDTWMLDARYWMQDIGYRMLDARYWMQDIGYRMLDAGYSSFPDIPYICTLKIQKKQYG